MSVLTPDRKKEILLEVIEGLRKKVEDNVIGDMMIDADEKVTPIFKMGSAEPVKIISEGFRYTIDVDYLVPKEAEG